MEVHSWNFLITWYVVIQEGGVLKSYQELSYLNLQIFWPQGKRWLVVVFQVSGGLQQNPGETSCLFSMKGLWWNNVIMKSPYQKYRGGLFHISFIGSKLEPLGKYFNNSACSNTGIMLCNDIQRSKKITCTVAHTDYNTINNCSLFL